MLIGKNLSDAEHKVLARACESGALLASELHDRVIKATGAKQAEKFYGELRSSLQGMGTFFGSE